MLPDLGDRLRQRVAPCLQADVELALVQVPDAAEHLPAGLHVAGHVGEEPEERVEVRELERDAGRAGRRVDEHVERAPVLVHVREVLRALARRELAAVEHDALRGELAPDLLVDRARLGQAVRRHDDALARAQGAPEAAQPRLLVRREAVHVVGGAREPVPVEVHGVRWPHRGEHRPGAVAQIRVHDDHVARVRHHPLEYGERRREVLVQPAVELGEDRLDLVEDQQVDGRVRAARRRQPVERLDLHDEPRVGHRAQLGAAGHVRVEREVGERLEEGPPEGLPERDEPDNAVVDRVGGEVLVEVPAQRLCLAELHLGADGERRDQLVVAHGRLAVLVAAVPRERLELARERRVRVVLGRPQRLQVQPEAVLCGARSWLRLSHPCRHYLQVASRNRDGGVHECLAARLTAVLNNVTGGGRAVRLQRQH